MYGDLIYNDYTEELKAKRRPLVRQIVSMMILFADLIAISSAFLLSLPVTYAFSFLFFESAAGIHLAQYAQIQDIFFVWMCPLALLMFFQKGHYTQRVPWWSQVQHTLAIAFFGFLIDVFARFAVLVTFSWGIIACTWGLVFLLTLAGRLTVRYLAKSRDVWDIPTAIIGDIDTVTDTLYAFANDKYTGYNVHTVFLRDRKAGSFDLTNVPSMYENIRVIRNSHYYNNYIENNLDHFFVLALETFRGEERDKLINTLNRLQALYAIIPPISRTSLYEMEPRYFFGHDVMLLHSKNSFHAPLGRFLKRAMDIAVAGSALLILSPILLATAIMLKVEGQGGSLFYGGYRIGQRGQRFRCWKFRSMEPDSDHLLNKLLEENPEAKEEWEKYRKLKNDPRVTTRTARLIRKASIDELPQLWNVLVGDMSLVGPRPILEKEISYFGESLNEYLQVRPGITGLWQVSGRNETSFERRVYWDSWYVRNWSIWGDIVIMIKTLNVVITGHGAY
ncbi:MAG: undecaprenyl-phosphate galactose phosphotransferase WbaP [Alphaproteobacteria bacterium]|nr:undecaprenyl-phosphate galactose phosphotransferase WbaP [Alphaproteobacteria bacterium]MCB9974712.1 undecaprenyl-phosphate galactose phosphotransferase WbaP [Rhodospirillales bacterium]